MNSKNAPTVVNIAKELLALLPMLAKKIIVNRQENRNFINNPDDPKEHAKRWHQFGIITHTRAFYEAYQKEAPKYFKEWDLDFKINTKLSEKIDGREKWELLQISIPLHDIGKFDREIIFRNGQMDTSYYLHEAKSEKLIIENTIVNNLLYEEFNLTDSQIIYIGRCAGLHFELGKTRDAVKKTNLGFTIDFANSKECKNTFDEIFFSYPEFKTEIGILFLCDSLAKTDVRIDAKTDKEIMAKSEEIEVILQKRNLYPGLKAAIKQVPVNLEIAKKYLETI
jgi:hypothetical protein